MVRRAGGGVGEGVREGEVRVEEGGEVSSTAGSVVIEGMVPPQMSLSIN